MGLRPEFVLLLAAGALAGLIVLARVTLIPDPPGTMAVPEANDLRRLGAYLEPVPESQATPETVRIPRDPFGTGLAQSSGAEDEPRREAARWRLSALLISGDRRSAVVNDRMVRPGDVLPDGARIATVERDHVVLIAPDGRRLRLELERGGAR